MQRDFFHLQGEGWVQIRGKEAVGGSVQSSPARQSRRGGGFHREIDFKGEKRSNETHAVDDRHLSGSFIGFAAVSRYRIFT